MVADVIADTAAHVAFHDSLNDGAESWLVGHLQSVANLEGSTRLVLDLVTGFDRTVKMEEDEVELLPPQHVSTYTRMLAASYTTHSVQVRCDFILALVVLLFFFAEDLEGWDPSLLSEIFTVFHSVAMLCHAAEQPTFDTAPFTAIDDVDEVATRLCTVLERRFQPCPVAAPHLLRPFAR